MTQTRQAHSEELAAIQEWADKIFEIFKEHEYDGKSNALLKGKYYDDTYELRLVVTNPTIRNFTIEGPNKKRVAYVQITADGTVADSTKFDDQGMSHYGHIQFQQSLVEKDDKAGAQKLLEWVQTVDWQ